MKYALSILLMGLLLCGTLALAEEARLLRFPHLSKDKVVFSYAGDIYTAPRTGGTATRLTSHEGLEMFAKFSPDGSQIAFSGQYDDDMSVYVMPAAGGEPKRLTYHRGISTMAERMGPDNIVMGWHPDGKSVLFRSRKDVAHGWDGRAYLAKLDGGMAEPLPMALAGFTSYSPDAQKVAYCPIFRDFRTWKRYKGGMAQDVWIFDLKTYENKQITDWVGTDNLPMWYQDKIYFNSDQTGTLNIYCYDIASGQTRQVTQFTEYDVRWPSLGVDGIAFENGGFLYVMDLPSETVKKVTIDLTADLPQMRTEFVKLADKIGEFDIAPDGKRAVFSARNEIVTVPAKEGNTRNLTNSSGVCDKEPLWSPDSKWIAFISDETGEDEIYIISQDGKEKVRLTTDGNCRRYRVIWSPDSKKLVFSDKNLKLYYIDVAAKKTVQIDKATRNEITDFNWSPDSRYLAYSKTLHENRISAIFIYDFTDGAIHQVTPGFTEENNPAFDPEGKFLYFMSLRNFNPILSNYEFSFSNRSITNLYLILLQADGASPFAPGSDESGMKEEDKDGAEKSGKGEKKEDAKGDAKKDAEKKEPVKVKIDFDGIYDRQVAFDLPAGEYGNLQAIKGAVFYTAYPIFGLSGKIGTGEPTLHKYNIKDKKDVEFAPGISGYALSADGEKLLIAKQGSYHIVDAAGEKASFEDNRLDLSHMQMKLDRRAEYAQIFEEAWRLQRDYFYDEKMHGVDWNKMRERYRALLPYAAIRYDLTYVIGEMIGELACSHTYVGGGEKPDLPTGKVGLLGVDFALDKANNRIKIAHILAGENWDEGLRSPLRDPKVNVKEGEYLLAINGKEVTGDIDPYSLTMNTIGQTMTLTVNSQPTMKGAREVTVKPVSEEDRLRYYDWVEQNRRYVDSVSGGTIGYIHIPDMGDFGLVRFAKMFYHQLRKQGLVIDVRYNGGGFVSRLVLDRLNRKVTGIDFSRNFARDFDPGSAVNAHMITLMNQFSTSDGDNFPYYFRELGLGPLLGKRTWGGIVGIRGFRPMADGGFVYVPEFTTYSLDSKWIMENHGVDPDMELENMPDRAARGYDDQLDKGIEYLQKKIKEQPIALPPHQGPPAKR